LIARWRNSSDVADQAADRAVEGASCSAPRADGRRRVATGAVWVLVIANDPIHGATAALWVLVIANDPIGYMIIEA
jgi:hypothetical protein